MVVQWRVHCKTVVGVGEQDRLHLPHGPTAQITLRPQCMPGPQQLTPDKSHNTIPNNPVNRNTRTLEAVPHRAWQLDAVLMCLARGHARSGGQA